MSDAQQPPRFPTEIPPYPPAPAPAPPVPSSQRFPTWKQAFVIFGGGLALAISACFGCLFTVMGSGGRANASLEGFAMLLGILAFGGAIAALVGVVLVCMRILRALFSGSGDRTSSSDHDSSNSDAEARRTTDGHPRSGDDGDRDSHGDSGGDSGGGDGGGDGD